MAIAYSVEANNRYKRLELQHMSNFDDFFKKHGVNPLNLSELKVEHRIQRPDGSKETFTVEADANNPGKKQEEELLIAALEKITRGVNFGR